MTICIGRLLSVLKDVGRRYVGVFGRWKGESDEQRRLRVQRFIKAILDSLPSEKKTVDEVILDASNRLRFALARAVLNAVLALHGNGLQNCNTELFFEVAYRALAGELYFYFVASEALGAQRLLIVLDAWKDDLLLMQKGRDAPGDKTISLLDKKKIDSFTAACASTLAHKGEQSAVQTEQ
jgi:hypothetical protein